MIIGNALSFFSHEEVGLKPELTVTSESGSTLDILQNSIIIDTYTLGEGESVHTFILPGTGTYVARATKSSLTKESTINVDVVTKYSVTLLFIKYLYNQGDQCESATGGWRSYPTAIISSFGVGTATFEASDIKLGGTSSSRSWATDTNNAIDLTPFSYLCIRGTGSSSNMYMRLGVRSSNTGNYEGTFSAQYNRDGQAFPAEGTDIDISGLSGSFYVLLGEHYLANTYLYVTQVYLR